MGSVAGLGSADVADTAGRRDGGERAILRALKIGS
jgi:hypothetical protein